jgi:hypothetical protein
MCASPAISLDSGLVDVGDVFGINLDDAERITYRRKTTCTVLSLDGYTRIRKSIPTDRLLFRRELFPDEEFIEYMYGIFPKAGTPLTLSLLEANLSGTFGRV